MPSPLLFSIIPIGNSAIFRLHLRADSHLQGNLKGKMCTDHLQSTDRLQDAENRDQLYSTKLIPDYATDDLEEWLLHMTRAEQNNIHWLCQQSSSLALMLETDQRRCAARQTEDWTYESDQDFEAAEIDADAGGAATSHTYIALSADSSDSAPHSPRDAKWRGKRLFVDSVEATVCSYVQQGSEHITEDTVLLHIPMGYLSIVLFASFKTAKVLFHTLSSMLASADVIRMTKPIWDLYKLVKQQQSDDSLACSKGHNLQHGI
eukprot:3396718-Rhodomonas_salina.2